MGRPRTPSAVLEQRGAYTAHPERRRKHEPKPQVGIGVCPFGKDDPRLLVWEELEGLFATGVLTLTDRPAFENLVTIFTQFRQAPSEFSPTMHGRLHAALTQFGMTPASRARIVVANPGDEKDDPYKEFLN